MKSKTNVTQIVKGEPEAGGASKKRARKKKKKHKASLHSEASGPGSCEECIFLGKSVHLCCSMLGIRQGHITESGKCYICSYKKL